MDSLEQLSGAIRESAAAVESLRAATAALQSQIGGVEAHLAAAMTAQARTASDLERLRGELGRVATLERSVAHLTEERDAQLAEMGESMRQGDREVRLLMEQGTERTARELLALVNRLDGLPALTQRLAALEHRQRDLTTELLALSQRHDELAGQRTDLEDAARQREARLAKAQDGLAHDLAEVRRQLAEWQARIEGQDEAVRSSRAVADSMVAEVVALQAAQHELAETQRVFENRVAARLASAEERADATWRDFLSMRRHEWEHLRGELAAAAAGVDEGLASIPVLIAAREEEASERKALADAMAVQVQDLRRQLLDVVAAARSALGEAARDIETRLPYDERPTVIEERQQALRREKRARSDASEDRAR